MIVCSTLCDENSTSYRNPRNQPFLLKIADSANSYIEKYWRHLTKHSIFFRKILTSSRKNWDLASPMRFLALKLMLVHSRIIFIIVWRIAQEKCLWSIYVRAFTKPFLKNSNSSYCVLSEDVRIGIVRPTNVNESTLCPHHFALTK